MNKIFLISPDTVKTYSNLDTNLFEKYFFPAISAAQSIELRTTLGDTLYNELLTMVKEGSITAETNTLYKTLLDDYVQPFLIYQTIVNLIPIVSTKIVNLGTMMSNDEHMVNLSQPERELVERHYTRIAAHNRMLLVNFLNDNFSNYCDRQQSWDYAPIWLGGEVAR